MMKRFCLFFLIVGFGYTNLALGFLPPPSFSRTAFTITLLSSQDDEQTAVQNDQAAVTNDGAAFPAVRKIPSSDLLYEPTTEMLTEKWKEVNSDDEEKQGSSPLVAIVGAVALAIALGFAAQVPVGQEELNKYASIKSGTAATQSIDLGDLNAARKSNAVSP